MAIDDIGSNAPKQLTLSDHAVAFLKEIAKWGNFLSIVWFVMIGFMVVFAFLGTAVSESLQDSSVFSYTEEGGASVTIFYLVSAVLYFFPAYYLFNFSKNMKAALMSKDDETLSKSFEYLKSHYKFVGILTIIGLSLFLLMFLFLLIGLSAM